MQLSTMKMLGSVACPLEGIAIEDHDDILSYGQNLDIAHIHNEADLRTMVMFRKRPIPTENPCLSNQGNCDHFCIPAANNQRKCGCSVGFQKSVGGQSGRCEKYSSFSVVSQLGLARGFSLSDHREAMMPISGKGERAEFNILSCIKQI